MFSKLLYQFCILHKIKKNRMGTWSVGRLYHRIMKERIKSDTADKEQNGSRVNRSCVVNAFVPT